MDYEFNVGRIIRHVIYQYISGIIGILLVVGIAYIQEHGLPIPVK